MAKKPVTFAIIGCGNRGLKSYAPYTSVYPEQAQIVAAVDPIAARLSEAQEQYEIEKSQCFRSWEDFLKAPKVADAVILATQDTAHVEPAIACMERGYHVLLEKPMATTEEDCRAIVECAERTGVHLSVCHVLRYSSYFRKLREIVQSGVLGQIATVRHIEQVAYWHYVHSFVRGNWRNSRESSPMILAKCCHDLDILQYILDEPCVKLSSFGNLMHFKPENKPEDAASRCIDCRLADRGCEYSAKKFYMARWEQENFGWPLSVITDDFTQQGVERALQEGPYGRCVYECDNDVVDHQVVNMEFASGISVSLTMTAFNEELCRKTEILGSRGELHGDGDTITVKTFESSEPVIYSFEDPDSSLSGKHYGGDVGIMKAFIDLLAGERKAENISSAEKSLQSHLMAFAAERSRLNGTVENL